MGDQFQEKASGVLVPWENISTDALDGLIESFVLREGTDYGSIEYSLEQKIVHVRKQLHTKKVLVLFDPNEESVTLVTKIDFERNNPER